MWGYGVFAGLIVVSLVFATDPSYVAYHNYYRKLHGLNDLTYDTTIATTAQSYATSMAPTGGPCNSHSSGHNYGENLAWSSSQSLTADQSYLDAVQSWYSEVKNWNFPTSAPTGGTTGHFTQVTWAATTKVGCGRSQGTGGTCTVCNYSPAGNSAGQYASNINDCDTSIAFKCATYKSCIPQAERCNGVSDQCGVGGDIWRGTNYYYSSNDDESSCPTTSPTPACTNTDGTEANSASCTCNAGSCSGYSCSPGPGIGTTCLAGQYCKSASSECSGAANAGSSPTSTPGSTTGAPTHAPTAAPTQASTLFECQITMSQRLTFASTLTTAQQNTVTSTYKTQLETTFNSTSYSWNCTISSARRADYTISSTGSTSDASAFKTASSSSSSTFNTALSNSLNAAGVASSSVSDYSVSVSDSNNSGSSGLSGGAIAGIVIGCIIFVALIVGLIVFMVFKLKNKEPDSSKSVSKTTNVGLKQEVSGVRH